MDRKLNPRHPRVYVYFVLILVAAVAAAQFSTRTSRSSGGPGDPTIATDKSTYLPGETIVFSSDGDETGTIQATADGKGAFSVTSIMADNEVEGNKFSRPEKRKAYASATTGGIASYLAVGTGSTSGVSAETEFSGTDPLTDGERLIDQESYWMHRLTYPTGNYSPEWLRKAAADDSKVARGVPSGPKNKNVVNHA